ncbi:MAG TPA: sulfatase, partial [Armatimonadota bacterium]|nr:sulfatase [Armatimonadota bacterium]
MGERMGRRKFLAQAGAGAIAAGAAVRAGAQERPPNFVFILVDDMGWADLPCYGNAFVDTPSIDRLASQGMRFTDAYAACPVCSPTRASILSGKYPAHVNVTDFIPGHWRPYEKLIVPEFNLQLPPEEVTVAEALKRSGYATASIGKWHLGGQDSLPDKHGFDLSMPHVPNAGDKRIGGITEASLQFMTDHRDDPFFLFMGHHTVHIPLEARRQLVGKYERRAEQMQAPCHPTYAAMIEQLDESTGEVMGKLDELGIADETMVIFYSDNGGLIRRFDGKGEVVDSLGPLRGEKGTLYEGGIRVPLIVRWPGKVRPTSVNRTPVTSPDFYPTMLEAAGTTGDSGHWLDGESLVPILRGRGKLQRDSVYWHYPHYHHSTPAGSIRR